LYDFFKTVRNANIPPTMIKFTYFNSLGSHFVVTSVCQHYTHLRYHGNVTIVNVIIC